MDSSVRPVRPLITEGTREQVLMLGSEVEPDSHAKAKVSPQLEGVAMPDAQTRLVVEKYQARLRTASFRRAGIK